MPLLIITKANAGRSRVHRRAHLRDYVGRQAVQRNWPADRRAAAIGLFTANLYHECHRCHPVSAKEGRPMTSTARKASMRRAAPAVHWRWCWKAIRATSCSRSTAIRYAPLRYQHHESIGAAADPRAGGGPTNLTRIHLRSRLRTEGCATTPQSATGRLASSPGADLPATGRVSAAFLRPIRKVRLQHFYSSIVAVTKTKTPQIDQEALEQGIAAIVQSWKRMGWGTRSKLVMVVRAHALLARCGDAFSAAYREAFSADDATRDIDILERLSEEDQPHTN